jgi:hypothetical protein
MKRLLLAIAPIVLTLALPSASPPALRIAAAWLAIFASGMLWQAGPLQLGSWLQWERIARAACLHLLLLLGVLGLLGVGPAKFGFGLVASWCIPLLWRRQRDRPRPSEVASVWPFALVALALALWLATHAPDIDLGSDAPAHLGAIVDAAQQDRWRPLDRSAPGLVASYDPRFGVWHGLYAALASALALPPESILRYSPLILSPLWLLAHAQLFALWLPRPIVALALACLFTLGGADGRGFGSVFAAYPASVALALAALALAAIFRRNAGERRLWQADAVLLGLSVLVHPFAWFVSLLLLAHAILLQRLFGQRAWSRSLLQALAISFCVGLIALWPTLAQRSHSSDGWHAMPLNVVYLSERLFVCDPLRVLRWGGGLSLWILPLALLFARRRLCDARASLFAAGLICVWSVAMNPLLQPWVYAAVGYLSERLGRVAYPEVLGAMLLARPWNERFSPRRRGARLFLFCVAIVGAALIGRGAAHTLRALRHEPQPNPQWQRVHEIAGALEHRGEAILLADPRLSYGLRALRGGPIALYPLAHASPADHELPRRLAAYRDLLDPSADAALMQQAVRELRADLLLLRADVEASEPSFGFVADADKQLRLQRRLADAANQPIAQGEGWWAYELGELRFGAADAPLWECEAARGLTALAVGSRFDVVAVRAPRSVDAGSMLELEITYRAHATTLRSPHPDFERVHLRLSGPMPHLPQWLAPAGKPIRKLLIERSGRSEARFGGGYVPFGAYWPPARWPDGRACERIRLPVPARMPAGNYSLEITVQEATWQPRYDWRDYLSDRDRYSAPAAATIEIEGAAP